MKARYFLLFLATTADANPQSSASYAVNPDATDFGGGQSASALYVNDGSAAEITGVSSIAAPLETAQHSYIGQLYELASFQITATPASVNEGATRQLAATAILDDLTTIPWDPGQVTWNVLTGPVVSISAAGLATAGIVYQNTPATVQGEAGTASGTLVLTVLNTNPDNFGLYAGDSIDDDWQVHYFGVNNPLAGPLLDPDHDGFDNLFEFRACLVPNDPLSFLAMDVESTPGGGHSVTFSPRLPDCTYTLLGSSDLSLWAPVTGAITDAGATRTIDDPLGTTARRFYRLEVQRP